VSTLREGLLPPRREMSEADLEPLRTYFEGQSRIQFAAWASHARGADAVDDHVLLGTADGDLRNEHVAALEIGLLLEVPHPHPGWVDLFAMSDLETGALREAGIPIGAMSAGLPGDERVLTTVLHER